MDDQIIKLIRQMTLEEKVSLCSGGSGFSTQAIERLGIPEIRMTDGPNGVRWSNPDGPSNDLEDYGLAVISELVPDSNFMNSLCPVTCFPTSSTTASSWDRELLKDIGRSLGEECQQLGVDLLLAPAINIKRHPLTGRNYEYFSEDPCLTGELAAAYVRGVQSEGVGTSVKHFACNNAEFERLSMSSEVNERALHEIYLAGFERVIRAANPWTVMSAYNQLNGVEAYRNKYLLTKILREEWGFEGVVLSDWWSVSDRAGALQAGLDLEMPNHAQSDAQLLEAVESGELAERRLDEVCERILTLVHKSVEHRRSDFRADFEAHHALARKAAAESLVLLKNEGNLLPLETTTRKGIAILGWFARRPRYQGLGCSLVNPAQLSTAFDAIQQIVGENTPVFYSDGYATDGSADEALLVEAIEAAKSADVAVIFAGLPWDQEMESWDRKNLDIPTGHTLLIREVARTQPNTVVVLSNGSCIGMLPWLNEVPAVIEAWLGGQAGGEAVADILFGSATPCGKLAVTVPRRLEDTPAYLHFPGERGKHLYGEGIFVGYRYYDTKRIEPLFPFGYGLSYTTFEYSEIQADKDTFSDLEGTTVSCKITNSGSRFGKEIVQLYVTDPESRLRRPIRELKAFEKVGLHPGESAIVSFPLRGRDFSYFDPALGRWVAESGNFDICIGRSSREILLRKTVQLESTQNNFIPFTSQNYIQDFLERPEARAILRDFLVQYRLIDPQDIDESLEKIRSMFVPIDKAMEFFSHGAVPSTALEDLLSRINFETSNGTEA